MRKLWMLLPALVLLASLPAAMGQEKKKKGEETTRSVQGVVMMADDTPAVGAIVKLKNTKTLQIRSFITQDGGTYYFHGLSPDIDYELQADSKSTGTSSNTKTLTSFDSRKQANIDLKLNQKK